MMTPARREAGVSGIEPLPLFCKREAPMSAGFCCPKSSNRKKNLLDIRLWFVYIRGHPPPFSLNTRNRPHGGVSVARHHSSLLRSRAFTLIELLVVIAIIA